MTHQTIRTIVYDFYDGPFFSLTGAAGRMIKKITGAGPPTVSAVLGEAVLALTADNEAQNLCLFLDDHLPFDIDELVQARFWCRVSTTMGAATKWRIGLASARNDNPDTIAQSIFFGADASTALIAECDDGTNEVAATSIGTPIGSTLKKFVMDFAVGSMVASPPTLSTGGKTSVRMAAEDAGGMLRTVLPNTRFNMSAYTGGLQPYVQVQKTAGTTVGTLNVARIEIDCKVPD